MITKTLIQLLTVLATTSCVHRFSSACVPMHPSDIREKELLLREIDSASIVVPNDLASAILVVETYKYDDFLQLWSHGFHINHDNRQMRKYFREYQRKKEKLLSNPVCEVVYRDKGDYDGYDVDRFKYSLRRTNRLMLADSTIYTETVEPEGAWVSIIVYYIYNRQTNEVYREIDDLRKLSRITK